jgi:hypothetical protein
MSFDPCRFNQGIKLQMRSDVNANDADQDDGKPYGVKEYRERLDQEYKSNSHQDYGDGHNPGPQFFLG